MGKMDGLAEKFGSLKDKFVAKALSAEDMPEEIQPENTPDTPLGKVLNVFRQIGVWIYRLRKVFMAIPVVYAAVRLAIYNSNNLPEQVGLNLQASGEFAQFIDRNLAVYGPLGITAACLLLMFCSRKAFHPWVISMFTLVVPLLLLLTNMYPQ